MSTVSGFITRVGFVAVIIFFIFASFNYIYYQYLRYNETKKRIPPPIRKNIIFIMFVSSLSGAFFFLMVTFFAYWYSKTHDIPGEKLLPGVEARSSAGK